MKKQLFAKFKPLLRVLLVGSLVCTLVINAGDALAARSGGRVGGGSFRRSTPTRPYSSPRRTSPGAPVPVPVYPGGGFGFPFLLPFFGIGGFGSLFTILIFIAIANFLFNSFRRVAQSGDGGGYSDGYIEASTNPPVALNSLHVGLLAEARGLQAELNQIARSANTGSSEGLSLVLQETILALLRHPEFWAYASSSSQQTRLQAAESQFNRLALAERSKVQQETLVNVNKQLREVERQSLPGADQDGALTTQAPGEYILVTLLTASEGKLELPKLNSAQDLRQALNQLGAISSDRLLALEVLWQPQAEGDTLTSDDLIASYPDLVLL